MLQGRNLGSATEPGPALPPTFTDEIVRLRAQNDNEVGAHNCQL